MAYLASTDVYYPPTPPSSPLSVILAAADERLLSLPSRAATLLSPDKPRVARLRTGEPV